MTRSSSVFSGDWSAIFRKAKQSPKNKEAHIASLNFGRPEYDWVVSQMQGTARKSFGTVPITTGKVPGLYSVDVSHDENLGIAYVVFTFVAPLPSAAPAQGAAVSVSLEPLLTELRRIANLLSDIHAQMKRGEKWTEAQELLAMRMLSSLGITPSEPNEPNQ